MMHFTDLHREILSIALAAGSKHGLVLAGGYAIQAHDLVVRPSQDLDFATSHSLPLEQIAHHLVSAFESHGFHVRFIEGTPRMARLDVTRASDICEVDLLKEAIGQPVHMAFGPVLSLRDAVGLKMRALHDRTVARDFIDLHAAAKYFSTIEIESLGRRHNDEFSLAELADRLGTLEFIDDEDFKAYGLDSEETARIRSWAGHWQIDIQQRLYEEEVLTQSV